MTELPPDPGFRLGPVRRPAPPALPDPTVELRPAAPRGDLRTVQLRPAVPSPDAEQTVRLDPVETLPAPAPVPPSAPASAPEGGLRRFGPGVPPGAAAVWRGEAVAVAPSRRWDRWLLVPLALLLALLGYLLWDRYGRPVGVVGVTVGTSAAGPGCDGTAVVAGTLETDGGEGEVRYRWVRSDGTDSGPVVQHVAAGHRRTGVTLEWTFQGRGEFAATARLEVLEPVGVRPAEAVFGYSCP
ncbi:MULTISPECIES: hypothetical protein [Kitasatospora]|uniref:Uncharacterized protein n=1 Tax=Kitasatospora setae (strain ATCC 33774 / DSM 43861 / JCM 3304 / KCC A-0304 / NBRC 14216 / KM-6054) TaxID=452652 RepID=E4N4Z0_KITSK|nr:MULTISPECIES: hypothetical protein [Kitasatospora]BAJ26271.1 hypothetical protein KSE_04240 [Kitasatospora setae KM-6054]